MDYAALPHFCRKKGSGSSRHSENGLVDNCFSLDHAFHQELYNYVNLQAESLETVAPIKEGSFHVKLPEPDPEDAEIARTIETEFHKFGTQNGLVKSVNNLRVNGSWNLHGGSDYASLADIAVETRQSRLPNTLETFYRRVVELLM